MAAKPETQATETRTLNELAEHHEANGKSDLGLSPELTELVMELRETVKRIDPRKHTPKTLRRSLSIVGDILSDIDNLTARKG